ncbi:putative periplasmic beta-glucosidase [Diaporthe ampelina]|uniref:beta-glucosidase n=1 Tax=Diaporthe ampelina TaxID=1214573 RepID=A0A0G2FSQ4_9PEZI|nr:putative periplasmic beta-glucosidase [Diaporthe ampelina]
MIQTLTLLVPVVIVDLGITAEAYEKAVAFVSTLTNAQKVSVITGSDISDSNVTWEAYTATDGGSGINKQFYVSGFSVPASLTMTWDRELIAEQFKAIGEEFYGVSNPQRKGENTLHINKTGQQGTNHTQNVSQMGYKLVYGPVVSPAGRVPEGGRNAEGFSFDAYLSGIAMGQAVTGMNSAGVITSGRHFLFNEQETNRMTGERYSSNVGDKTAQEVYLWPFADGVRAGMTAVMCAMNRANGTRSCENNRLLSGYLKTDLGFPGYVLPDVQSQSTSYGSANAGLDFGSSTYWTEAIVEAGIANGSMTQARLDDMAVRVVLPYYFAGLDDGKIPAEADTTEYRDVRGDHAQLIRRAGAESIVLLKNNGVLPLRSPRTMSVFGAHAGPAMAGPNQPFGVSGTADTYQGHLATAGGSGQASFPYLITPQMALTLRQSQNGGMIWWILNNTYTSTSTGSSPGGGGGGGMGGIAGIGGGTGVDQSIPDYAANSAVCLVFINADSGEGADRTALYDAEQDTLVTTVAANCNNTVVVINAVGPRLVDAWVDHDNVTAVVYGGLLGQESGNAIADVLYGDVNPSGKLTYSIAKNESDYANGICTTADYECDFTEGVYVDYRWFDAKNITPRYEFGYGLSYTTFDYGKVDVKTTNASALSSKYATGVLGLGGQQDLWDEVIEVTASVSNTGAVEGAEVAQLYVTFPDEAEQPIRVLRGFEKVNVKPGQSAAVTFSLRRRDVSYYDAAAGKWAVASGDYTFAVGSSSRDIKGSAKLTI